MANPALPEDAVKQLGLEKLAQLHLNREAAQDGRRYIFLGIGQVILSYDASIAKSDAYITKLAGADSPYFAVRGTRATARLRGAVPSGATHYCLGSTITQEEACRSTNVAYSDDIVPIVFLRANE